MKLRTHLIILVTVAMIPVVLFAAVVIALLTREQVRTTEEGLRGTTRALSAAIDERVSSVITGLRLLGSAEKISDGTLGDMHKRSMRAVATEDGWQAIALADAKGQYLLHTDRPFGSTLPSVANEAFFRRVLETGAPVMSGFVIGRISHAPGVVVAVPIFERDEERDQLKYVLMASIRSDALTRLVQAQNIPHEWTAAVLDADAVIIARSRAAETFIGKSATPRLAALTRSRSEDVFSDFTQEGRRAHGVFTRSSLSGWTVVLGIPEPFMDRQRSHPLWIILAGGVSFLLAGVCMALWFGSRIARPIAGLASSAAALGRGESLALPSSSVAEVKGLADALENAASERRRSEETLREANATFDALIRHSPAAILMVEASGQVRIWNPAAERIFGRPSGDVVARRLRDLGDPQLASLEAIVVSALEDEPLRAVEWKQRRTSGEEVVLQISTAALRASSAHPDRVMALIDDVTERSLTLERLAEERQTVDTLHHIGSALSGELDLQRLVQLLTDEAVALTGAEFGAYFDVTGERAPEFRLYTLSGASYEAFENFPAPRATALFGPTMRGEAVVRSADVLKDSRYGKNAPHAGMPKGHLPVRSYLAVPVRSRSGEVLGGLFFGHSRPDIFTARHERLMTSVAAQAAVAIDNARLYRDAQAAVRLRDDFLSVASHELKTPLTPVRLQLQLLLKRAAADPAALTAESVIGTLQRVDGRLVRLSRLVDELLDVSRIVAGRVELHPEPFDLVAVVAEIVTQFEPERARSGSDVTLFGDPHVQGVWDRGRVEQIVTNLLTNALKYGGGRPIDVSLRTDGADVELAVRDRGIGIAPEDQERIFDRFERAVSNRQYSGLGLGLWIVRRIVEALGGEISLQSTPGEGSIFTVRLPRQMHDDAPEATPRPIVS